MRRIAMASAAFTLLVGAAPAFAQDNGAQCPEGQFRCASMNNACATGPQCDAADKASNKQTPPPDNRQVPPPQDNKQMPPREDRRGDPNKGGDPNQGRRPEQNMMGPGNMGPGPQDTRWMGQPGMSPEDFEKQDAERQKRDEERQKKDDERMKKEQERNVKRMQGDVKRFSGEVKRMKSEITRQEKSLKKCGIGLPQDVTAALADTDAILAKAAAGTDFEEIQNAQMDLQEKMQVVRESQMSFGYLQGFCRMLPEADKMLKKATKEYNRVVKAASRNKELDLSEVKADYEAEFNKLQGVLNQVKEKMTVAPEEAMEMMQDDFFPGFEDVFNSIGHIDALANSSKGVKSLESQLKRAKKNLSTLQKKGKDVADLSDAIGQLESAVSEAKSVSRQRKFDPEELMGAFEDAFEALDQVSNALGELGVRNPDYAKSFNMPKNGPQFNVPQFKGLPQRQQGPGMGPGGPEMMGPGGPGFGSGPMSPGGEGFGPGGPGMGPGGFPGGPGGFPGGQEMMGPPPGGGFEGGDFGPGAQKKPQTQVAKR